MSHDVTKSFTTGSKSLEVLLKFYIVIDHRRGGYLETRPLQPISFKVKFLLGNVRNEPFLIDCESLQVHFMQSGSAHF